MTCKKRNAMRKICKAGIVMSAVLALVGCSGKTGNQGVEEWDGAKADLESGLRVKEAVYTYTGTPYEFLGESDPYRYGISYDVEGGITSVTHSENASLIMPDAFKCVLDLDGALYRFEISEGTYEMQKDFFFYEKGEYNSTLRKLDRKEPEAHVTFSENGTPLNGTWDTYRQIYDENKYDRKGRLIEVTRYAQDTFLEPIVMSMKMRTICSYQKNGVETDSIIFLINVFMTQMGMLSNC